MEIVDNYLDKTSFKLLNEAMNSDMFPWFFNDYKLNPDTDDDSLFNYQLTHVFYKDFKINSNYFDTLYPLILKMNVKALVRIKANLLTRTPKIVVNDYHVDHDKKNWNTSIFYINTNNGYTEFKDGTIISSVANRLITFPSEMAHRGTSCTDEKSRVVINFNWM